MNIQEKLNADLKSAMLARDATTAETLRGLKSAILYEEVALKKRDTGLDEEEAIAVLKREAKKRNDAITLYRQGGNESSAQKEQVELDLIQGYLPEALSEEETVTLVEKVMREMGIDQPQRADTGKIIGATKGYAGASVDLALVAKIVKQKIG